MLYIFMDRHAGTPVSSYVCCHLIYSGRQVCGHNGVTQEEGHTGFLHLSAVIALIFNNTTNTSVIKHALVPNGWVGGWVVGWCGGGLLGGVVVGGGGGGGRGAKAKVHSTFWVVGGVGGVGWVVVVVVVVRGRRQRCIVPSGW